MYDRALILDGWDTALDGRFTLSALSIDPPQVAEDRQSIPGLSGDVDLTEAVSGYPTYKTRKLTASLETSFGPRENRISMVDELCRRVHGKRVQIGHPDYSGWYYVGRMSVSSIKHHAAYSELQLSAVCDPYRYEEALTTTLAAAKAASIGTTEHSYQVVSASDSAEVRNTQGSLSLHITCAVGESAVICVTASAKTTYYVAMLRTVGRGRWQLAAADNAADYAETCYVTTGTDGKFYIKIDKYSSEVLRYVYLRAVPVASLTRAEIGTAPVVAEVYAQRPLLLSVGGTYHQVDGTIKQIVLPAGDQRLLAISDSGGEWVAAEYRRLAW